uniref:Uncharacterized protein n=1 Tax=Picea glauca TaxID=3330 RepID=A0A101M355_PICGL|nr:hypothetical protein ABT39_MTgene29 [Picea glauca]QHR89343.1 hypothetical protein Q903MT_gene3364 [Picea sitchensis]
MLALFCLADQHRTPFRNLLGPPLSLPTMNPLIGVSSSPTWALLYKGSQLLKTIRSLFKKEDEKLFHTSEDDQPFHAIQQSIMESSGL